MKVFIAKILLLSTMINGYKEFNSSALLEEVNKNVLNPFKNLLQKKE